MLEIPKFQTVMKASRLTTSLLAILTASTLAAVNHTVKTGDTVSSIARKYQVPPAKIAQWNKLTDPSKISIGDQLLVSPPKKATANKASKAKNGRYTVAKGDTFYSIARRHSLSVEKLKALNPSSNPTLISPGQTLLVSGKPPVAKVKKTAKTKKIASAPKKTPKVKKAVVVKSPPKKQTPTPVVKKVSKPVKQIAQATPEKITKPTLPTPRPEPKISVVAVEKPALPTPPTPPIVEKKPVAPTKVTSVILTNVTTLGDFASKHRTTASQLNALNGWNYPQATVLARGSEIYVPQ